MKVSVDGQPLFEINDIKMKVLSYVIPAEDLEEDLKRRLEYIISHKYEACLKKLKSDWEPKMKANGVKMLPLDDDEFANLVFSQPGYVGRMSRSDEEKEYEKNKK